MPGAESASLRLRAVGSAATLLLLWAALPAPATASPETLKRSVGNILFGPFDVATSPIQGPRTVYDNIRYVDDSMWVRVVYVVPGVVWNTSMQIGGGLLRTMSGIIELVPGLLLAFVETDLDPLFAPAQRGDALVDVETALLHVKIGVNYVD